MNRPLEQADGGGMATGVAMSAPSASFATVTATWSDVLALAKMRISVMVLIVTAIGFALGAGDGFSLTALVHCLIGTGLVAVAANILNQVAERDFDRRMIRTRNRPVASGRMDAGEAAALGWSAAVVGTAYLLIWTNLLATALAVATFVLYLLAYTPLKRVSIYNTHVGAIPGALPPLIGFAAAAGHLPPLAWTLFGILFAWQLPHFFAIAWMHREDYLRGGYRMLSSVDHDGRRTGRWIVGYGIVQLIISLSPWWIGATGTLYAVGAAAGGLALLGVGTRVAILRTAASARAMLLATVIYLPLLLTLLWIDRV